MRRRRKRALLIAVGSLLAIIIILSVVDIGVVSTPYGRVYIGGLRSIPFDSEIWRVANGDIAQFGQAPAWDVRRARMLNDLTRNHLREGMSPTEVEKLLGKPSYVYVDKSGEEQLQVGMYEILAFPNSVQRWIAKEVWGNPSPVLQIEYHGDPLKCTDIDVQ